jgi:phosphopantothenoylcysteine decarboxylase / phosphopantothenate---cysteine ligase
MARILIGVSGGIAAYKAVELVRLATGAGHAVRIIQTPASLRFVGRATFEGVTGAPALSEEFEPDPARGAFPGDPVPPHDPISHLELVRRCDVLCIAPASANTIAKLAHGLADNLLTSAALACTAPVVIAPAMNNHMYEHPATRENLETLRRRGARIVDPGEGRLASQGEWGVGRLAEPAELLAAIEAAIEGGRRARGAGLGPDRSDSRARGAGLGPDRSDSFNPRSLDGMRVLVTAGGTREPIDSVRYVGNRSSGRMGLALAAEAARRGAEVTAVCANVSLPRPEAVESVDVETAAELLDAAISRFEDADVLLMAAAVADFRPASALDDKIAKRGLDGLTLELEPTEDVLARLAERRRAGQILIGFAAEHGEDGVARGREKLTRKGLDAVVVNDISRSDIGFDATDNEVTIVTGRGERRVERGSKAATAAAILDEVERLRTVAGAPSTVERER